MLVQSLTLVQQPNYLWLDTVLCMKNIHFLKILCPIKVNRNTIELTVHTSCYCVLDLLCVSLQRPGRSYNQLLPEMQARTEHGSKNNHFHCSIGALFPSDQTNTIKRIFPYLYISFKQRICFHFQLMMLSNGLKKI